MSGQPDFVSDWRTFATPHRIERASVAGDDVVATWSDGRETRHHTFWLRDNCACAQCYLPLTREQLFEIVDAPENLAVAEAARADGRLAVAWSDGHRSVYEAGWLRAHAGDDASRRERRAAEPQPFIWGREYADRLQSFAYAEIMQDDGALLAWLDALKSSGMTLVEDVPAEHEALLKPIARISHLRETNFGRVFDVKSKPAADSAAYTAVLLPPHTDLPTRELQPGVQFLHCLVNDATGGESVFVDGFAIGKPCAARRPRRSDADDDADGVLEPRRAHRLSLERADPGARRKGRNRGGALRQFPARADRRAGRRDGRRSTRRCVCSRR